MLRARAFVLALPLLVVGCGGNGPDRDGGPVINPFPFAGTRTGSLQLNETIDRFALGRIAADGSFEIFSAVGAFNTEQMTGVVSPSGRIATSTLLVSSTLLTYSGRGRVTQDAAGTTFTLTYEDPMTPGTNDLRYVVRLAASDPAPLSQ